MLIFDQLRISDDGSKMYINAHVNTADYFDNVYLDSITIAVASAVSERYKDSQTDPCTTSSDYIYKKVFGANEKEMALVLDKSSFDAAFANLDGLTATSAFSGNFSNTMFFVYVKCKLAAGATLDPCIPCSLDEDVTLGVVFDTAALYQRAMGYTRELADTCNIPSGFIDFILNFNALKISIDTGHYIPAINFFNQLIGNSGSNASYRTSKPCGCHG